MLAFLCVACVGQKEEVLEGDLEFVADRVLLSVDNNEMAVFSVFFNGEDVTAESRILDVTGDVPIELQGAEFLPQEAGEYKFQAYFMDVPTQVLNIRALKENGSGNFLKKWMIMKFTATWCVNCPGMSDAIKSVKNEMPGRIIDIEVHHIDDFETVAGKKYVEYFNVSAIPVAIVDLNKGTQTSVASATLLKNSINRVVDANLPVCGVKIASAAQDERLVVDVESTITGDGRYKFAVALLGDGLVKAQTGGSTDYVHNGVLMGMLQQDAMGDDLGECKAGETVSRRYDYPMENLSGTGKYRLVAFILKECGPEAYLVNNTTECKLYGSTDYLYELSE